MKNNICQLIIIIMSLSICGCGNAVTSSDTAVNEKHNNNKFDLNVGLDNTIDESDDAIDWMGTYKNSLDEIISVIFVDDTSIKIEITQIDEFGEFYTLTKTLNRDSQNEKIATEMFNEVNDIYYTLEDDCITITYPEGWFEEEHFFKMNSENSDNSDIEISNLDYRTYPKLDSDLLEVYYLNIYGSDPESLEYYTDSFGNVVEIYLPLSERTLLTATYYSNGWLSTVTDSMGITKKYERNENGQKTKITNSNASGKITAYTIFEYDASDKRVSDSIYDANMNLQLQYTYKYDANGNRVELSVEDGSGNLCGVEKYEYDQSGRLIGMLSSDGIYIKYIYDNNKFVRMEEYDNEYNLLATDTYLYYLTGNLYEMLEY